MARNVDDPSRNSGRSGSKRLANTRTAPPPRTRLDRRTFWIRLVAGLLVLVMLLPVLAGVISVL